MTDVSTPERAYQTWSVDQYVGMFSGIYGERNRFLSNQDLWLHVVEELGELAEDLRKQHITPRQDSKGQMNGILVNTADTFAWLCAFAARHGSLEDMLWSKFPGACPYCFSEQNCNCISNKLRPANHDALLSRHRRQTERRPKTLYGWQQMLHRIYGNTNKLQNMEQLGFHLMEEVGEVAKAMRIRDTALLKEELADVFGWIVGVIGKVSHVTLHDYRLDDLTWERYPNQCWKCKANPCTCKD